MVKQEWRCLTNEIPQGQFLEKLLKLLEIIIRIMNTEQFQIMIVAKTSLFRDPCSLFDIHKEPQSTAKANNDIDPSIFPMPIPIIVKIYSPFGSDLSTSSSQ